MDSLNHNFKYFEHIGKQLLENMFSNAKIDIYLRKLFDKQQNFSFKDIDCDNNLHVQTLSLLLNQDINYYIKNLNIIVDKENYKVIDLKYDYYVIDEIVLKTEIIFI